jgi:hypothetical protein
MRKRVDQAKETTFEYSLLHFNCQHFATQLRNGEAVSSEIDAMSRAIPKAIDQTVNFGKEVSEKMAPLLSFRLVEGSTVVGQCCNVICTVVLFIILVILLLMLCLMSLAINTFSNYMDERSDTTANQEPAAAVSETK